MEKNKNNYDAVLYFSKTADKYNDVTHNKSIGTKYLSSIETNFVEQIIKKSREEESNRCLEIGAGTGRFTEILVRHGYTIDIVEGAEGMVEILKNKFREKKVTIIKSDAGKKFPFNSDTFDCIIAIRVLKYIPEWRETVREAHRVLKDKGDFILSISNVYSLAYFKGSAGYSLFKPQEVTQYIKKLGFEIIDITPTSRFPFPVYCKIDSKIMLSIVSKIEALLNQIFPVWFLSRALIIHVRKSS